MTRQQAIRFRDLLNRLIDALPDEEALDVVDLYLPWRVGEIYAIGDRRQYNGKLYRCIQAHTAQVDYTPDVSISLWTEISIDEWPEWVQPVGAGTGYPLGAKVSHKSKHWINTGKDDNEYEPGVWGWEEVPT